jgi:hypothetical protein
MANTTMFLYKYKDEPEKRLFLTYINFHFFHGGKMNRMLDLVSEKMERECGFQPGAIAKTTELAKATSTHGKHEFVNKHGFFLLHDGKELYCASVMDFHVITTRWVPPKHRGKGYATIMLTAIQAAFQDYDAIPLWIISYARMHTINSRAGWVMNSKVNVDRNTGEPGVGEKEQHDWWPPAFADRREAWITRKENPRYLARWRKQWRDFVESSGRCDLDLKVCL